ncbi:MAG: hypothetical protein MHPSP_001711, partial [Paramarteilia canceri]
MIVLASKYDVSQQDILWSEIGFKVLLILLFNCIPNDYIPDEFDDPEEHKAKILKFRKYTHLCSVGGASLLLLFILIFNLPRYGFLFLIIEILLLNNTNGSEGQLFENSYYQGGKL